MTANIFIFLADAILILHTGIVFFIIGGLIFIWVGYFRGWEFIRNPWFRLSHLLAIGFVSVQTLLGAHCPLTIWENYLRTKGGALTQYEGTFIGHWLEKFLFYDLALQTFAVIYAGFFLFVIFTWFWVKPNHFKRRNDESRGNAPLFQA